MANSPGFHKFPFLPFLISSLPGYVLPVGEHGARRAQNNNKGSVSLQIIHALSAVVTLQKVPSTFQIKRSVRPKTLALARGATLGTLNTSARWSQVCASSMTMCSTTFFLHIHMKNINLSFTISVFLVARFVFVSLFIVWAYVGLC